MSRQAGIDLSGRWTGFFNYPLALPPVNFEATLRDAGGRLTGSTREPDHFGRPVDAVIDGQRQGASVSFIKMYDHAEEGYDVVRYSGTVAGDGDEVEGRWNIEGGWSGTFLMIRASTTTGTVKLEAAEPVDRSS